MVLNNISEKRRTLKKIFILIMCITVSLVFVSCSNTPSETKTQSQEDTQAVSELQNNTITEKSTETVKNAEKKIEKFYVNYNGFKMDVNFDKQDIKELLDAEKNATVPDVKMKTSFAELIAIYNDNTDDIFGTIYIGEDDCYYLQFANSKVEGAAFKMSDSSFTDGLF